MKLKLVNGGTRGGSWVEDEDGNMEDYLEFM